jgi:hypothetical protein
MTPTKTGGIMAQQTKAQRSQAAKKAAATRLK